MEKVFKGKEEEFSESWCNKFNTLVALLLFLGPIHFNLLFILFAIFFLLLSKSLFAITVFGYEPHSVMTIGVIALAANTGFMPLPKTKVLATSATVLLKERRGFVRIAMQMGQPLVPVFCFGQTNVYKWWKAPGKLIQNIAMSMKIFPLFFWGIYGSPVPFKNPLYVVVGRPIEVEKNPEATPEQVAKVHGQFVEALEDLFQRYKTRAGYPNLHLKIL